MTQPGRIVHQQEQVLAIHWPPDFIPMPLISKRLKAMYPAKRRSLTIPNRHKEITTCGDYAGVEIYCYSHGFKQKVQLLLHFVKSRLDEADLLKSILAHTFKHRPSQLFEFIHTITRPVEARITLAASETGVNEALIQFTRV